MAKKAKIKVHSVKYVSVSDIFKGEEVLWSEYTSADPDHSWGDNARSLVRPSQMLQHLSELESYDEDNPSQAFQRLEAMWDTTKDDVLVDLES